MIYEVSRLKAIFVVLEQVVAFSYEQCTLKYRRMIFILFSYIPHRVRKSESGLRMIIPGFY